MAIQTNNITLPAPPMPSTRDIDNITNTIKQLVNLPSIGLNQMIDGINNLNKSAIAQFQNAVQNVPAFPFPFPQPQQTSSQVNVTPSNPVITAQSVRPVRKNDKGPITV